MIVLDLSKRFEDRFMVSDFRASMLDHGYDISFFEAVQILIDAGICERINNGVAPVSEADVIRAGENNRRFDH